MLKRFVPLLLALGMLTISAPGLSEQTASAAPRSAVGDVTGQDGQMIPEPVTTVVTNIKSTGNLVLGIDATGLFAQGYEYADIITVTLPGQELEMPIVSSFSDVESGLLCCHAEYNEATGKTSLSLRSTSPISPRTWASRQKSIWRSIPVSDGIIWCRRRLKLQSR